MIIYSKAPPRSPQRAPALKSTAADVIRAVNEAALPRFESLCCSWLPGGRKVGQEYEALNPTRADENAGSFRINLRTGRWAEFATDDKGGDPVSLFAYLNGLKQMEAARALGRDLGVL